MEEDQVRLVLLLCGGLVMLMLLVRSMNTSVQARNRRRRVHLTEARRHFVKAASLVEEARKIPKGDEARSLAGTAINEADIAIELDPNDAAIHLVKSLALEQLGKSAAAVKVLGTALSPRLNRSLSKTERADTLAKRAELLLGQGGGVLEALVDLQDSIKLGSRNPRLYLMLGTCYERIGNTDKALEAFKHCLVLDPSSPDAKAAVERNMGIYSGY